MSVKNPHNESTFNFNSRVFYSHNISKNWTNVSKWRINSAYLMYLRVGHIAERIMSIARKTFEGARNPLAAAVFAAGVSLVSLSGAAAQDLASVDQNSPQTAAPTQTFKGKPVTLRVGKGYSLSEANYIAAFLKQEGCEATVTSERGFPKHITVDVDGFKAARFTSEEIGDAGGVALERCLDRI